MRRLGIVAHSAEGGALCFQTACREGDRRLGAHMHPEIVVSAIPMGISMPAWEADDFAAIEPIFERGVEQVAAAGADFWICPDNTGHIVLERIADRMPIPGLHIATVVCREMSRCGWCRAGLLGTRWTMTGTVYAEALEAAGFDRLVPDEQVRTALDRAIFDELCRGDFRPSTTDLFLEAIEGLRERGADCVILGCTEIPLIVSDENSCLPVLDSTRLLARYGVETALDEVSLEVVGGWITPR